MGFSPNTATAWGYPMHPNAVVKPKPSGNTQGPGVYGTQYYQQPQAPKPPAAPAPTPTAPAPSQINNVPAPPLTSLPAPNLAGDNQLLTDLANAGLAGAQALRPELTSFKFDTAAANQALAQQLAGIDLQKSQAGASHSQEIKFAKDSLAQTLAELAFQKPQDILAQARANHASGLINSSEQNMDIGNINKGYSLKDQAAHTDYNHQVSASDLAYNQLLARLAQDASNAKATNALDIGRLNATHNDFMTTFHEQYGNLVDDTGNLVPVQFQTNPDGSVTPVVTGTIGAGVVHDAIVRGQQNAHDNPPPTDTQPRNPDTGGTTTLSQPNTSAVQAVAQAIQQHNAANASAASGPIRVVQGHDSKGNPGVWHYYANRPPVFIRK